MGAPTFPRKGAKGTTMADGQRTPPGAGEQWWRKGKPGRLKSSMVGISAAAVLGVYAAGYVSSSDAASAGERVQAVTPMSATTIPGATVAATPRATSTPQTGPTTGRAPTGATPAAPTATPTAARTTVATAYQDGTYSGTGAGPHGGMTVSVAVQGGRITSVEITSCNTRWPCSRIADMPARVVAAQSSQVAYVTRATDSSVAFVRAVAAALEQAR